ncbi:DUF1768-domain-containing protein [Jaminaea rosea]|uniref:DUF1768-domain-containing protein n=1 Tax=Jaminaea rosea TaxID=1569628 RepID=A0A316UNL2_9BASI|nr:DUF1768-domain-containing protein [Jaminaea rosea]PWN25951.1 DUF1768-domain-containing protein [Jaminaea rosea]
MSAAVVAEQHPPPSSWTKARRFFSGGKRSSRAGSSVRGGEADGAAQPYHLEDDDAKDQGGRSSPAPATTAGGGKGKEPAAAAAVTDAATQPAEQDKQDAALASQPERGDATPAAEGSTAQKSRRNSQASAVSAPAGEGERDQPAIEQEEDDGTGDAPAVIEFLHKGAPYFWLSNHFLIPIYYDGIRYSSAEHLFQSLKFPHRPDLAKAVRRAETPSEAVRVARKHAPDVRKGWRAEGLNVIAMREVLLLKFTQHGALRSRLLQTGDADLINASPTDVFWGAGRGIGASKPGVGRNELGKALKATRNLLAESAGLGWGSGAKTV